MGSSSGASMPVGEGEAAVQMHLSRSVVIGDERPNATLVNTGDVILVHGVPFKLERRENGAWRWVNRGQAFPMPLLELRPGETSRSQPIGFFGPPGARRALLPGVYRVTKAVSPARSYPGPPVLHVRAIFRVAETS